MVMPIYAVIYIFLKWKYENNEDCAKWLPKVTEGGKIGCQAEEAFKGILSTWKSHSFQKILHLWLSQITRKMTRREMEAEKDSRIMADG